MPKGGWVQPPALPRTIGQCGLFGGQSIGIGQGLGWPRHNQRATLRAKGKASGIGRHNGARGHLPLPATCRQKNQCHQPRLFQLFSRHRAHTALFLGLDTIFDFLAEMAHKALNGPSRRIAKRADRVTFDLFGDG